MPPGTERGGMPRRLVARLIDALLWVVLAAGISLLISFDIDDERGNAAEALLTGIWLLTWGAYEIGGTAKFGATLGKRLTGLRVIQQYNGDRPSVGTAAKRWGSFVGLSAVIPCFGMLVVALSPTYDKSGREQGWHDRIAKTVVVRGRRPSA